MLDPVLLFVRYTVHAVPLLDLCPGDVTVMEMTYTRREQVGTYCYLSIPSL
jgi:hypothetical protein